MANVNGKKPLIGVSSNIFYDQISQLNFIERARYIEAVVHACDAIPVIIPALGERLDIDGLLDRIDGLFFTGSPSNVHPSIYGDTKKKPETLEDRMRDATNLPLMRAAVAMGMPVICVCRGFQECNVAFGGSLHQHIEEVEGFNDHRYKDETKFTPVHAIRVVADGLLAKIYNGKLDWMVNSAHGQGIARLAPSLKAEAYSPDGVIEAVSMPSAKGFLLALQWHPEHATVINEWHNMVLFENFRAAIDAFRASR